MRKRRKGRSIDHYWQFVKYKGDGAFHARCSCGFRYSCYEHDDALRIVPSPEKLYYYCPNCGERKTRYYEEPVYIDKYWFE